MPFPDNRAVINVNGYETFIPNYSGDLLTYDVPTVNGLVEIAGCCIGVRGNFDGDAEEDVNVVDLTQLVSYLFAGGDAPICMEEGNFDGDPSENVNVVDLTLLVEYLFNGGGGPASM